MTEEMLIWNKETSKGEKRQALVLFYSFEEAEYQ